jgi:glycosyltransferase involved in cell wall biosynthesis
MKVYKYSPFQPKQTGHGGEKRAKQIEDLLLSLKTEHETLKLPELNKSSRFTRLISHFLNFRSIKELNIPFNSFKQYRIISSNYSNAKKLISKFKEKSIIIYEHSIALNWFIPLLLKKQGHILIIIPHNLESLVPFQKSGISSASSPDGFLEEIQLLKHADLVLTISKEEEWLLNLFNINTLYYPYSPSNEEIIILNAIAKGREIRKANQSFLIIGSASNPPTKYGMIELLGKLDNNRTLNCKFHIAGYNTETLVNEITYPDRFIFHGTVDTEELHDLYKTVDAAILYQQPSTGALTKIPELLSAGIPVIANQHSARNYFNIDNVLIYREFDELLDLLEKSLNFNSKYYHNNDANLEIIKKNIKKITDLI